MSQREKFHNVFACLLSLIHIKSMNSLGDLNGIRIEELG